MIQTTVVFDRDMMVLHVGCVLHCSEVSGYLVFKTRTSLRLSSFSSTATIRIPVQWFLQVTWIASMG